MRKEHLIPSAICIFIFDYKFTKIQRQFSLQIRETLQYFNFVPENNLFVFFCFLCPSQQFFSHVGMGLPGLNQYLKQQIKCLAEGHNIETVSGETWTS